MGNGRDGAVQEHLTRSAEGLISRPSGVTCPPDSGSSEWCTKEARLSGPRRVWLNQANQLTLPPSSSTKAIFTITRNWVTWLFSTTASNSLAQTDWILRIVLDARCTAWRIASSYPCEDWPDRSMNLPTDECLPRPLGPAMGCPEPLEGNPLVSSLIDLAWRGEGSS